MTKIYLSGPVNSGDNPYDWHEQVQSAFPDMEWVNPFLLHDIPDEELRTRAHEIIEKDMSTIEQCDAMLLRRIDKYNLCGASMEAREAYLHDIPVFVWNRADTEIPLFLHGHAEKTYPSMEEAAEAAISAAERRDA